MIKKSRKGKKTVTSRFDDLFFSASFLGIVGVCMLVSTLITSIAMDGKFTTSEPEQLSAEYGMCERVQYRSKESPTMLALNRDLEDGYRIDREATEGSDSYVLKKSVPCDEFGNPISVD